MEDAERKRLKRLGKQAVIDNSKRIAEIQKEANPAPIGSDAWARNYRECVAIERAARAIDDRTISAQEAAQKYVLNAKDDEFRRGYPAIHGWFYHCFLCGELVPARPRRSLGCRCGNVLLNVDTREILLRYRDSITLVELVGRSGGG